jgi:hypothetical protein
MKSELYKNQEKAILAAVDAYNADKNQKITSLARQFEVPYERLRRRIAGQKSRSTRQQSNKLFTDDQESAITTWIQHLDNIGASPTVDLVRNCANSILQRMNPNQQPSPTVGPNWPYRFISRLPNEYKRIKQKPVDPNRIKSEDIGVVQTWFDRLEIQLKQYKISPSNLYNMDETGFRIGQGKQEAVVTAYSETNTRIGSASIRESITIVECIAADGFVLFPMIIFAGKAHMEEWYQQNLENEYQIAVSDNGFITDKIAFEWIQKFDSETAKRAGKDYRLLLMDNHGSHLTYEFITYCNEKKIILYCFPSHSTHFLQPLDGIPFQQYKHFHGKTVNEQARLGGLVFDKSDFLYSLRDIRLKTFKSRTIRAGFADRGIHPWNPNIVLDQLKKEVNSDSESVLTIFNDSERSSPSTIESISPPKTIQKLRTNVNKARKSLQEIDTILDTLNPRLNRRLDKIFEGSLIQAELNAQRAEDIENLMKLNKRKSIKKTRRQVQVGGVLTVKDANRSIQTRKIEEMKKSARKAARNVKQQQKTQTTQPTNMDNTALDFNENPSQSISDTDNSLFCIDRIGWVDN